MAQVMQAACPGCKAILRIPAEWVGQSIRCKACGAQVQARPPVPPPPPPARKAAPPPPPPTATTKGPPAPARVATAPAPATAFDFEGAEDDRPSRRTRRKKGGLGAWITLGVLLLIGGGLAGAAVIFWPQIQQAVRDPDSLAGGKKEDGGKGGKGGKGEAVGAFPRRALVISVHNYLYANPLPNPPKDEANLQAFLAALGDKLKISPDQLIHLSDAAREPRPPLKGVIREGLVNFLKTSRKQDRVLVFFIGHTAEIDGQLYLVPLEGELTDAKNLIPLKEVLDEMGKCPARQKVLVLDGNRFSPSQGEERPTSGPMGDKLEALLKAPPAGVQVLASCSKGQRSWELSNASMGAFLNAFRLALAPGEGAKGAVDGKIQTRDDLLPLDHLHTAINANIVRQLDDYPVTEGDGANKQKVKQVALLAGKPPADGAAFDANEKPAPLPAIPVPKMANPRLVKEIMREVSLPPLKGGEGAGLDVAADQLPPFPEEALKKYEQGDLPEGSAVKKAVHDARVMIWAVSSSSPPSDIAQEVKAVRDKLGSAEGRMVRQIGKGETANKPVLDTRLRNNSTAFARIIARMDAIKDQLEEAQAEVKKAPPRWQATFTLVRGRFLAQMAYLEEYSNVIGQMLKEVPPAEEKHTGWRMAAKKKASDSVGRKYDKQAQTLFRGVVGSHAETPWDVLARRELLNNLGLEWQPF